VAFPAIARRSRRATSPAGPPSRVTAPADRPSGTTDDTPTRHTAEVTVTESPDVESGWEPSTEASPARPRPSLDLLVWDAPNIDMTLATVIGARPTAASRPRFDAIASWFVNGAGDPAGSGSDDVEACVFANVPPQHVTTLRGWVEALRSFGYSVFARPKSRPDDDIDQSMLDHIEVRAASHDLRRLVVFSGDGRNFAEPLETLARSGTEVVVVAFSEVAGYALSSDLLRFVDIEDVPGAFAAPLDRVRLDSLPVDGAWLRPTKSLREAAAAFVAKRAT